MPRLLRELDRTSLIFWKDGGDFTWPQALALLVSTASFFTFARLPFAGGAMPVDLSNLVVAFEILVAFIFVVTAGRLGPVEAWAPSLVRLLIVHLVLTMALLATNNLFPWAREFPCNSHTAAVSTVVSTLALAWFSVRRSSEGNRLLVNWAFYASMSMITVITGFVTYYSVIPPGAC